MNEIFYVSNNPDPFHYDIVSSKFDKTAREKNLEKARSEYLSLFIGLCAQFNGGRLLINLPPSDNNWHFHIDIYWPVGTKKQDRLIGYEQRSSAGERWPGKIINWYGVLNKFNHGFPAAYDYHKSFPSFIWKKETPAYNRLLLPTVFTAKPPNFTRYQELNPAEWPAGNVPDYIYLAGSGLLLSLLAYFAFKPSK